MRTTPTSARRQWVAQCAEPGLGATACDLVYGRSARIASVRRSLGAIIRPALWTATNAWISTGELDVLTPKTGTSDRKRHLSRTGLALALATLFAVAASCSQSDAAPTSAPAARTAQPQPAAARATPKPTAIVALPPQSEAPVSVEAKVRKLASGELLLPAAMSFGTRGFHEVLTDSQTFPADITAAAGRLLVLTLRDLGRPEQRCSREHPLSGCATVDWSDFDGRPNVPQGGVFEHRLVLQLASGEQSFFLSDSGSLSEAPDRYKSG